MTQLNKESIKRKTALSKLKYDLLKQRVSDYELDTQRHLRVIDLKCKSCYYLSDKGVFHTFVTYSCNNCFDEEVWRNSDYPKYCQDCSVEFEVCRYCGGEVD